MDVSIVTSRLQVRALSTVIFYCYLRLFTVTLNASVQFRSSVLFFISKECLLDHSNIQLLFFKNLEKQSSCSNPVVSRTLRCVSRTSIFVFITVTDSQQPSWKVPYIFLTHIRTCFSAFSLYTKRAYENAVFSCKTCLFVRGPF